MTSAEFSEFVATLGELYPRWSKLAASGAYSKQLYECFREFDAIDAGETARQMRRADMEQRDPPINDLLKILRGRMKTNRRALAVKHANDPTFDDRIEIRAIRGLCDAELASWTDTDVWKLYHYTQGAWQSLDPWTDKHGTVHEPRPPHGMFWGGGFHLPDEYERSALLGRLRAATLR